MNSATPISPEIEEILKDPKLFDKIDREFDKMIVGEKKARRTIFLFSCGRLVLNAESTSTNLLVNDESGMGKDHVTKNVLKIYPNWNGNPGIVHHRVRISPTAFCYWHNCKFEEDWTWDGKIFYGEDISNNVLNSDMFKLMA
ncbi:unnamed protein product, partial [marine sediment metagenome]